MGNSEVGHQNIGAGRIVDQELMRITNAVRDGSFHERPALLEAIGHVESTGVVSTSSASSATGRSTATSNTSSPSSTPRAVAG